MRRHYERQRRFDSSPIAEVSLNFECRDETIPVLVGLQHVYTNQKLRHKVVKLVAEDLNSQTRRDVGRPGMDDWQVVVLAAVRLGCNYDYDKLQDQVENHRALRGILGIGEWEDADGFGARRIRDTLCLLQPRTIERLNQAIVSCGQEMHDSAGSSVRADSFVVETNIHYPTESSLIWDGVRKFVPLCEIGRTTRSLRLAAIKASEQEDQTVGQERFADQCQQKPQQERCFGIGLQ